MSLRMTEAALLALERIRQRFQRAVRFVLHRIRLARVVEKRVDSFLQHALLVAQDDFRSLDFDQSLQSVVANDDTAVKVVQVRRRKAAAVQRHQRAQFGRDDRDDAQHHPFGFVLALRSAERFDDVQALQRFRLALLRGLGRRLMTQGVGHRVEVHLLQQRVNRLGTHHRHELVRVAVVERLVAFRQRRQHIEVFLFREGRQPFDALFGSGTRVDDHIAFVVDDRFEFLRRDTQQVADFRRERAEIPDMHHRHHQRNMAHAFAAHLLLGHFHTAAVADDAFVADALVLSAVAFVVLHGAEDAFAEQTVALGLVGAVVDGLGLEHFAARLGQNLLRRGQSDGYAVVPVAALVVFGH